MTEQATQIQTDAIAAIDAASSEAALEEARVKFLGKKKFLVGDYPVYIDFYFYELLNSLKLH